jgi:opacity protein-like surface antigen
MKKLYLGALLLASLAAPLAANADDDYRGRGNPGAMEWRADGYAILYRYPGDRRWQRAPGSARDVGDGWVLGTDRRNGGYGIYRWNGRGWSRMPGSGVDIGGSFNNPWVINDRGERFSWTGYGWQQERGNGRRDDRNDRRDNGRWDRDNDRRDDDGRGRRRGN